VFGGLGQLLGDGRGLACPAWRRAARRPSAAAPSPRPGRLQLAPSGSPGSGRGTLSARAGLGRARSLRIAGDQLDAGQASAVRSRKDASWPAPYSAKVPAGRGFPRCLSASTPVTSRACTLITRPLSRTLNTSGFGDDVGVRAGGCRSRRRGRRARRPRARPTSWTGG
jgi:hypothetical protein